MTPAITRAFLSGTISATNNGASIYLEARKKPGSLPDRERQADEGRHSSRQHPPAGPAGFSTSPGPFTNLVMKYSNNQDAAKKSSSAGCRRRKSSTNGFTSQQGYNRRSDQDVGG